MFQKGDDPIDAINHMISFLTAVVTSRYPTTNNQLRNSSKLRQQATINNGRVTLQPIQGDKLLFLRVLQGLTLQKLVEAILGNKDDYLLLTIRRRHIVVIGGGNIQAQGQILIERTSIFGRSRNSRSCSHGEFNLIMVAISLLRTFKRKRNLFLGTDDGGLQDENSMNSLEPTLSIRPTTWGFPKELPKVSMVTRCAEMRRGDSESVCRIESLNNTTWGEEKVRDINKRTLGSSFGTSTLVDLIESVGSKEFTEF
ncbi:hypothetical protein Tco_0447947 [Tanacetum coccineum]